MQGLISVRVDDLLITKCPRSLLTLRKPCAASSSSARGKAPIGKTVQTVGHCGAQIRKKENGVHLSVTEYIHEIKSTTSQGDAKMSGCCEDFCLAVASNPRRSSTEQHRFQAIKHRDDSDDGRYS